MNTFQKVLLSAFVIASAGCATLCDDCDDCACCFRNKCRGYAAWWHWRPVYSGLDCESDFGSGFRAGYEAMATDGNSKAPALPPRSYWSPWYQNQYGHQQMQAWFDGYTHGAMAAEQDGLNQWSRIRTNPTSIILNPTVNNPNTINNSAKPPPQTGEGPALEDQSQPSVPVVPPSSDESSDQF